MCREDWEVLYGKYFPMVRAYFISRRPSPAEADDLAQEVFQALGQGPVPEDPGTYIHAVARNVLSRHLRRTMTEHAALDEYCRRVIVDNGRSASYVYDTEPSAEASTAAAERILKMAAARLPAKCAQLIGPWLIEGLSVKQIAQQMNCSENAVRKRIRRIRAGLRRFRPKGTKETSV